MASGASPVQNVSNQAVVEASRLGAVPPSDGGTAPEPSVAVSPASEVAAPLAVPIELVPAELMTAGLLLTTDDPGDVDAGTALELAVVPPESADEHPTASSEHVANTDISRAARFICMPSPTRLRNEPIEAGQPAEFSVTIPPDPDRSAS